MIISLSLNHLITLPSNNSITLYCLIMKKEDLRIVYMGTPDFAVEGLRCLVEGGYNVVGVITMPDKPAGRGHSPPSNSLH